MLQGQRRKAMKLLTALLALASVPAALAGNNAPLPKDKVAEFVAGKLDVPTLPASIRPNPQKNKKTFGDYGYVMQQMDDQQRLLEATPEGSQITIRILEQDESGIYDCVQAPGQRVGGGSVQRVLLLKLGNANGLLKSTASSKEFSGCAVVGGDAPDSSASSYGGR
jgi:hypothetical protein